MNKLYRIADEGSTLGREDSVKIPEENLLIEVLLLAFKDYMRAVKSGKAGKCVERKYKEFFHDNWIYPLLEVDGEVFAHAVDIYADDIRHKRRNKTFPKKAKVRYES